MSDGMVSLSEWEWQGVSLLVSVVTTLCAGALMAECLGLALVVISGLALSKILG